MKTPFYKHVLKLSVIGLMLHAAYSNAATIVVTSNSDSGAGTLRQAIADAASGDTITFASGLNGSAITLTSGQLAINNKNLTIRGPGPDLLAINGNASSRIFFVASPVAGTTTVAINGLSITNGFVSSASPGGGGGGGIRTSSAWNYFVRLTVSNCAFRANQSTTSTYEGGGGISGARETILTLVDCEFINNTDTQIGGGGAWTRGDMNILRCTFTGNKSNGNGGAIISRGSTTTIQNSTISGNSTVNSGSDAGAIYTHDGNTMRIYNTTITANSAIDQSGGILMGGASMSLHSTIVAGNTDTKGNPDIFGTITGVTNCLIQVTTGVTLPGANNITGQAAQLETLANNGGRTRTHALKKISPAINKGYNPLALTTDQRGAGYPRVLGIPAITDIGAYEYLPAPSATLLSIR